MIDDELDRHGSRYERADHDVVDVALMVRAVFGDDEYEERRGNQRLARAAIENGLLSRFLYWTKRRVSP